MGVVLDVVCSACGWKAGAHSGLEQDLRRANVQSGATLEHIDKFVLSRVPVVQC